MQKESVLASGREGLTEGLESDIIRGHLELEISLRVAGTAMLGIIRVSQTVTFREQCQRVSLTGYRAPLQDDCSLLYRADPLSRPSKYVQ